MEPHEEIGSPGSQQQEELLASSTEKCSLTSNKGNQICKDLTVSAVSNKPSSITVTITNTSKVASYGYFKTSLSLLGPVSRANDIDLFLNPQQSVQHIFSNLINGTYNLTTQISDVCTYTCNNIVVKNKKLT